MYKSPRFDISKSAALLTIFSHFDFVEHHQNSTVYSIRLQNMVLLNKIVVLMVDSLFISFIVVHYKLRTYWFIDWLIDWTKGVQLHFSARVHISLAIMPETPILELPTATPSRWHLSFSIVMRIQQLRNGDSVRPNRKY